MVIVEQLFHIWKESTYKNKQDASEELLKDDHCDYFLQRQVSEDKEEVDKLPDHMIITVLGLIFHCIADGFAFGSSGYSI